METLESLRKKIDSAHDIKSVVRTMKVVAASNIGQYETALASLGDYYKTIALGVVAYFKSAQMKPIETGKETPFEKKTEKSVYAIVFGSDQGLVGSFNDTLADFVFQRLKPIACKKEVWVIGERIEFLVTDAGLAITGKWPVPGSVKAITPLVGEILVRALKISENAAKSEFYLFHNQPAPASIYIPVSQRLLPLDELWRQGFDDMRWPTPLIPQVAGGIETTLSALVREYLFASLFKACAESLASENAGRLAAMQRAEKKIEELLDDLNNNMNLTRQSTIDEELFDVVSGFESMRKNQIN